MVNSFAVYIPSGPVADAADPPFSLPDSVEQTDGLPFGCKVFVQKKPQSSLIRVAQRQDGFAITIGGSYSADDLAEKLLTVDNKSSLEQLVAEHPGQYCGVVVSARLDSPIAVTDPMGQRALYCLTLTNGVLVGSNLGILRSLAGDEIAVPNRTDEAFLLRYAYLPPGKTVYRDVEELAPQQLIELEGVGVKSQSRFANDDLFQYDGDEPVGDLYQVLLDCTRHQLSDRKRVGVLLGGFDSALVASLLCRLGAEVETYSFRYDDAEFNQPLVDELADHLDIKHHWIKIDPEIVRTGIERYADCCNSPTVWPNYVVQTQHLCQVMSEHGMEGIFSGDGCDTAFLGYPSTHRRGRVYQRMPKLPRPFAGGIIRALDSVGMEYVFGHTFRVAKSLVHASCVAVDQRPLRSFQVFEPRSYRRLTGSPFPGEAECERILDRLGEKVGGLSYSRKVYFGKSKISPNRNKLISSIDISGLTIESPYLHPKLKSLAAKLPDELLRPSQKTSSKEGKALLMEMAESEGLLPREIIYQAKVAAIRSPIDQWYAGEMRSFLMNAMARLPFDANQKYIRSLVDDLAAERFYKRFLSDDMVVSLAASLLATYASYFPE